MNTSPSPRVGAPPGTSDGNAGETRSLALSRRGFLRSLGTLMLAAPAVRGDTWRLLSAFRQSRKRIYLAPDDHTDYFWSAGEEDYRSAFLSMLDYYLDLTDATETNPAEHQSRWNCDGSFWLWTYERHRSASQFNRLIRRLKDGHLSAPLNALVTCLGGAPAEAVLRGMYYPGKLERAYGLRFRMAISMENQTLPYGLISLWAGSGARFSWKGVCGCDTQVPSLGDRLHEIYYALGPDGSRILMKWHSLLQGNASIGGYAEARYPAAAVEFVDKSGSSWRATPTA